MISFLREDERILFYEAEVEAQESIHNHNAWAYQSETKTDETFGKSMDANQTITNGR